MILVARSVFTLGMNARRFKMSIVFDFATRIVLVYQPICLAADNKNAGAQVPGDLFPIFYADTPDGERLSQEPLSHCAGLGQVCLFQGKNQGDFMSFTTYHPQQKRSYAQLFHHLKLLFVDNLGIKP